MKYGPRVIDLDILFYGNLTIKTPELVVPHPLIQERDFVLGPLNEYNKTLFFTVFLL